MYLPNISMISTTTSRWDTSTSTKHFLFRSYSRRLPIWRKWRGTLILLYCL